jgi:hypothetical protein
VQEALVDEDPVRFFRPPYVGHKGWVGVRIDRKPDWSVVSGLVAEAYREVASPRLLARLEAQQDARRSGSQPRWRGDDVEWTDE